VTTKTLASHLRKIYSRKEKEHENMGGRSASAKGEDSSVERYTEDPVLISNRDG